MFIKIAAMPSEGRSGKVTVADPKDGSEMTFYDIVFPGLRLIEREV